MPRKKQPCRHCGKPVTLHGRFARCAGGETQFDPMTAELAASLANGFTEFGFSCDGAEITAIWDRLQSGADAAGDPVAMMLADAMKGKVRGT